MDTENVGEIARRTGLRTGFRHAVRLPDWPCGRTASTKGRRSSGSRSTPGWSVVLTVNRGSVPPEIVEALSSGGRRVLEAYFSGVVHPGHLIYMRDGDYIGDVYPPSEAGGSTEVEEVCGPRGKDSNS